MGGLRAALADLPRFPQQPVHRGDRGQVGALIDEQGPDLARGLVLEPRAIQDGKQLVALTGGQRVRRRRPPLPAPGPRAIAPAVNGGTRFTGELACLFHAGHRFQQIEGVLTYLADGFGESALPESISKSANAFPMISSAARVCSSFTSAFASRFRSRSFSASPAGRPLCATAGTASAAAADDLSDPESSALRQ